MDWIKILIDIEDLLFPQYEFDIWERGLYLYLLNQTQLRGLDSSIIPLSIISDALNCSDFQSRKTIRSLAEKGVIELEQTRKGHFVKVLLPSALGLQIKTCDIEHININEIDFFKNRNYILQLIEREKQQCFYCLSKITPENCELDHVVAQQKGGDNSYKNIVAACHKCNTRKQAMDAEDYLRFLYRKAILSDSEFEERLSALEALKDGMLLPKI